MRWTSVRRANGEPAGPPLEALRRPSMSTGSGRHALVRERYTLLSFERPAAPATPDWTEMPARLRALSPNLENCTVGQINSGITRPGVRVRSDHRQDSKGTRWMPWHQESKKGVDDCDKPR